MIKRYVQFIKENVNNDSLKERLMPIYNYVKEKYPKLKMNFSDPNYGTTLNIWTYIRDGEDDWKETGIGVWVRENEDDFHYQELDVHVGYDDTDRYEGMSKEAYDAGPIAVIEEYLDGRTETEYVTGTKLVEPDDIIDVEDTDSGTKLKMRVVDAEIEYGADGEKFQNIYAVDVNDEDREASVENQDNEFVVVEWM
jgi:hypothetical protein